MKVTQFQPSIEASEREQRLKEWKRAVERSFNWV
jgi:glycerol kinase